MKRAKLCKRSQRTGSQIHNMDEKYRKEAHRNTEKKYTEIQLNRKRNYVKGVEERLAGSPINAQAAELTRPRTIPALFRRNNCNNQLETFFKGSGNL